ASSIRRIDASFLLRSAAEGASAMLTTSSQWMISSRSENRAAAAGSSARMSAWRPNNKTRKSCCAWSACTTAGTVTRGPESPPIASTARVTIKAGFIRRLYRQRSDDRGRNHPESHGDGDGFHQWLRLLTAWAWSVHRAHDACHAWNGFCGFVELPWF